MTKGVKGFRKGHKHSEQTKQKIGDANRNQVYFNCDYCGKKASNSPSKYKRKIRHFCCQKCYSKYREEIMPIYEQPTWKGGITKKNQIGRGSGKYRNWMEQVMENSEGLCYLCGLIAEECHHIKSWVVFPEERYNPNNGVALCHKCHMKVHHENPELLKEE